jgi:signal transduction histidine kinase/predicted negative regulator of RcsB-dependent stress response
VLVATSFIGLRNWFRPPRHLLALFLVITLVLAGALGWLSWRVLEQERALEGQRLQERLDNAADLASAALLRSLAQMEERLNRLIALPEAQMATAAASLAEPETLLLNLTTTTVETYPGGQLLYVPLPVSAKETPVTVFAQAEAAEFQQKDYARAITALRVFARSEDQTIRAGALLRLARNLRKAGQAKAALAVYEELAQLPTTLIEGYPAQLLARHERCVLWQELNERPQLQTEAKLLYRELHQAGWPMTGATYRFYADAASNWLAPTETAQLAAEMHAPEALARSAGAEFLWEEWQRIKRGEGAGSGRLSLWHEKRAVFLLWRSTAERMVALIVSPRYFEQQWLSAMPARGEMRVHLALTDADGHQVLGNGAGTASPQALRTAAATQLPWTLHVVSTDARLSLGELTGRRSLWLGSLLVLGLLVLVGSYFIGRAVLRELEVARLQSDFVAAVSHEFRTPLTSICQLSELLADGRVSSEQRREEYYAGLRRESLRLQRLVEGLLDFGRMEAGAREYRFELCDTAALVREVSDEFAREVAERGYRLELNVADDLPCVRADREAFSRALWNLLDNAAKYSPHCQTLWVDAESANGTVMIRVRDQGLGIAPAEQTQIFQKFVRGTSARTAAAKGTGLGLAMVQHIVTAHGGRVLCESVPEQGTTFTIVLPKAKA